jgi:GTPase
MLFSVHNIQESVLFACTHVTHLFSFLKVPLVVKNEDDVITAGSNQLTENIVPIFCVSSVTGDGLELLTKFLHVLPPGISIKEKERLEQVYTSILIVSSESYLLCFLTYEGISKSFWTESIIKQTINTH